MFVKHTSVYNFLFQNAYRLYPHLERRWPATGFGSYLPRRKVVMAQSTQCTVIHVNSQPAVPNMEAYSQLSLVQLPVVW